MRCLTGWPTAITKWFSATPLKRARRRASISTIRCSLPARAAKFKLRSPPCAVSKPKLRRFDVRGLSAFAAADRELLLSQIRGQLLELESIRPWEKNPDLYSSGAAGAIFVIMSRNYAPPAERLKSVIARERLIPRLFQSARENLSNPPRVYTEVALEQVPGIVGFFQSDVPAAFKQVADEALVAEFHQSNQAVIDALQAYQDWLKNDLLPRSTGDFRIGAENYRKKLLYDEMVDTPLDRLLAIGYENLRHNQEWFRRVAAEIDPNRAPQQILEELESDHPAPGKLLDTFRGVLGGLRDIHRAAPHHHHSVARAAHRRRDAAVHARPDHGVDGHARPL